MEGDFIARATSSSSESVKEESVQPVNHPIAWDTAVQGTHTTPSDSDSELTDLDKSTADASDSDSESSDVEMGDTSTDNAPSMETSRSKRKPL